MKHNAIICATGGPPPQVVRTLLETYYRFLGYVIFYVCPKEDVLSWLSDGTQMPPGQWYPERESVPTDQYEVRFVLVDCDYMAFDWEIKGFPCLIVHV